MKWNHQLARFAVALFFSCFFPRALLVLVLPTQRWTPECGAPHPVPLDNWGLSPRFCNTARRLKVSWISLADAWRGAAQEWKKVGQEPWWMMAPPLFCLNFVLRHVSTVTEAMATDAASSQWAIRVRSLWPVMPCVQHAYGVCTTYLDVDYWWLWYVYILYMITYVIYVYTLFFNVEGKHRICQTQSLTCLNIVFLRYI